MMLSGRLEKTLRDAFEIAGENEHEYATLEHLLLALLDDEDASEVLLSCNVDLEELKSILGDFISNELTSLKVILRKIISCTGYSKTQSQN